MSSARTLGELRQSPFTAERLGSRRVKDELRENLMSRLREGSPIFPGIVGYDDTVVPQIVNAILSRHNFILLGLRGQAKSRILRAHGIARSGDALHRGLRDPRQSLFSDLPSLPRTRGERGRSHSDCLADARS